MRSMSKCKVSKRKKSQQLPNCCCCGRPNATLCTTEEKPRPLCDTCACEAGDRSPT